jgi:hypothetical protein
MRRDYYISIVRAAENQFRALRSSRTAIAANIASIANTAAKIFDPRN